MTAPPGRGDRSARVADGWRTVREASRVPEDRYACQEYSFGARSQPNAWPDRRGVVAAPSRKQRGALHGDEIAQAREPIAGHVHEPDSDATHALDVGEGVANDLSLTPNRIALAGQVRLEREPG